MIMVVAVLTVALKILMFLYLAVRAFCCQADAQIHCFFVLVIYGIIYRCLNFEENEG